MSRPHAEAFVESMKRCLAIPGFLASFYEVFVGSSEEVREKFRNTDFERQTRVLADSLFVLAVAAEGKTDESPAWAAMPGLAARHSRNDLDVRPELYDQWLDCLLLSAQRYDPQFSPEIEAAWRETLSVGIEYMRSRY